MEKIGLAAFVQMLVTLDQFDGHALCIGLPARAEQFFGGQLGRIQFFVLNETFQHRGPFRHVKGVDAALTDVTLL